MAKDESVVEQLVAVALANGTAMKAAERYEIDDVVRPGETREVLIKAFGYFGGRL